MTLRVVDPDDDERARPARSARSWCAGTTVMNGYWNRPELNEERPRGGWHHTNDLGRFEADGTFTFIGPKTRMLKSAAENIYPVEVENCIRAHPAVRGLRGDRGPRRVWVQSVTGHRRARRRRNRDAGRDRRALPCPHRVLQEAAVGRVRRRAARARASRSTTTRSMPRSAAAVTPAARPAACESGHASRGHAYFTAADVCAVIRAPSRSRARTR